MEELKTHVSDNYTWLKTSKNIAFFKGLVIKSGCVLGAAEFNWLLEMLLVNRHSSFHTLKIYDLKVSELQSKVNVSQLV